MAAKSTKPILIRALLSICLLFSYLIPLVSGNGKLFIGFLAYSGHDSRDVTGTCCDGPEVNGTCLGQCDLVFQISVLGIDGRSIINQRLSSIPLMDYNNSIKFPLPLVTEQTVNPITFQFDQWQDNITISVQIFDLDAIDEYPQNGDVLQLVDDVSLVLSLSRPSDMYQCVSAAGKGAHGSLLQLAVRYTCDPTYGGWDCAKDCLLNPWLEDCPNTGMQQAQLFSDVSAQAFHYFGNPMARCPSNPLNPEPTPTTDGRETELVSSDIPTKTIPTFSPTSTISASVPQTTSSLAGITSSMPSAGSRTTSSPTASTDVFDSTTYDGISPTATYKAPAVTSTHTTAESDIVPTTTTDIYSTKHDVISGSTTVDVTTSTNVFPTQGPPSVVLSTSVITSSATFASSSQGATLQTASMQTPAPSEITPADTTAASELTVLPSFSAGSSSSLTATNVLSVTPTPAHTPTHSSGPSVTSATETSRDVPNSNSMTTKTPPGMSETQIPTFQPTKTSRPQPPTTTAAPFVEPSPQPKPTATLTITMDPSVTTSLPEVSDDDPMQYWAIIVGCILGGLTMIALLGYIVYRSRQTSLQKRQEIYTVTPQMVSAIEENGTSGRSDIPMTTALL